MKKYEEITLMHFGIEFWDVADAISTIRLGKLIKKSKWCQF